MEVMPVKKLLFEGVCTALVTPFCEGKLNIPMFRRLLSRQLQAGVNAQVICGTTGEAPTLSHGEKIRLFKEARSWLGKDGILLAGTGNNCTATAVSLSQAAEDQGADGLLVVTPYYNKCTDAGLIRHYTAIADSVSIPILLYNVPSRTGVDISPSVCQELSQHPNIAGIKEASPDLRKIAEIIRICPEDFALYSGNDDLLLPILSLGGKGVISVVSNVKPKEMKSIWDRFVSGELNESRKEFLELLPLMKALFSEVNPIPVKEALRCLGYDCGECRLPLTPLSQAHLEKLKEVL